jgi:hypothetical protein
MAAGSLRLDRGLLTLLWIDRDLIGMVGTRDDADVHHDVDQVVELLPGSSSRRHLRLRAWRRCRFFRCGRSC